MTCQTATCVMTPYSQHDVHISLFFTMYTSLTSFTIRVTRPAWCAARLASDRNDTTKASAASCIHSRAALCHLIGSAVGKSLMLTSRITLAKGSLGISMEVVF